MHLAALGTAEVASQQQPLLQDTGPSRSSDERVVWQGVFTAAADKLEAASRVLDYALTIGDSLIDHKLLDLHSQHSWGTVYVQQASPLLSWVCRSRALSVLPVHNQAGLLTTRRLVHVGCRQPAVSCASPSSTTLHRLSGYVGLAWCQLLACSSYTLQPLSVPAVMAGQEMDAGRGYHRQQSAACAQAAAARATGPCAQMAKLNAALICSFAALPRLNRAHVRSHLSDTLSVWSGSILDLSLRHIRTWLVSVLPGGASDPVACRYVSVFAGRGWSLSAWAVLAFQASCITLPTMSLLPR